MRFYYSLLFIGFLIFGCNNKQTEPSSPNHPAIQDSTDHTAKQQNSETFNRSSSSFGQLVYIPVYSHIYQQDHKKTFNLTATLSIRNTDPHRSFKITEVSYYDSNGKLIQHYLEDTKTLPPLSSTSFVVEERDLRGGVGANFLVDWKSEQSITPPVIEAVMISTSQQQGISFLSEGRILQEYSQK